MTDLGLVSITISPAGAGLGAWLETQRENVQKAGEFLLNKFGKELHVLGFWTVSFRL